MDGILNIYKEKDMTSHDVVSKIRRLYGQKRVGHTGTLDPMAEGVLPVCLGKATRIIEYLDLDIKEYLCTMKLGYETDTYDVWGKERKRTSLDIVNRITEEDIRQIFSKYKGATRQVPPIYSALKLNGKKLYEYAREGKTVEIKGRTVYIHPPTIIELKIGQGFESQVKFSVKCSTGTYIRSMCRDIGNELGCFATMSELIRTSSGVFNIDKAVKLGELENFTENQRSSILVSAERPLENIGVINLEDYDAWRISNGLPVWISHCSIEKEPEYKDKSFPSIKSENEIGIDIPVEFKNMYKVFSEIDGVKTFIGVVTKDESGKNIIAHKIFRHI